MIDAPKDDLALILEAAYIYLAMGRFKESRQVFEGLIALVPKHEVPQVGLGNVLFAEKKYLLAIRSYKEAIKLNPKSTFAKVHLGEAYLFYGRKEEAKKELQETMTMEPKGNAAQFAKSLLELMDLGFDPVGLREEAKKRGLIKH